jgi:hypothetical protein
VDNGFELLDPQNAQSFLKRFSAPTRRKGEACFHDGRVHDLSVDDPGVSYTALVKDGEEFEVYLDYKPEEGWSGDCSCPDEFECAHIFAAMRLLLAEHSTAVVRNLSASIPSSVAAASRTGNKQSAADSGELARRVMTTLGRPLKADETKFVRKVQAVYTRCCQTRQIAHWDFQEMGLPLRGYGWNAIEAWPAFPSSEYEFWLYVANLAQQQDVALPPFMQAATDLTLIQERLAQWQRAKEVEQWKQTLASLQLPSAPSTAAPETRADLRVLIGEKEARLQWQRSGQPAFETFKHTQYRQLAEDYDGGAAALTAEGELLWHFFSQRLYYGRGSELRYEDAESSRLLGRLLRLRLLDTRIVNADGQPLIRPAEPLRWELTPAAGEDDDYRFRLVQAGGDAPPPILCVAAGIPPLYLTANAVFTGPPQAERVLSPARENRIPAPAIEQAHGVSFLFSMGLELPPRLRERVRTLPYQVAIKCELQPSQYASKSEDCLVSVLAETPDGHRLTWTGCNWLQSDSKRSSKKHRDDGFITRYDSAALEPVPILLEPLNLKPSGIGGGLVARVTKKFPEMFAVWLKSIPPHIKVQLAGDLASFAADVIAGRVKLDVTETEIDWFDLRVVLDVSDTTLTAEEIKLLLNAKGGYVRLAGKGWRRLQFDLSDDENERLARLGLSPRELSAEPQRLHALQLADDAAKKFLPEQQVEEIQRRAGEIKTRVAPELPAGVTAQLRPYQLEGFHFLAYLSANRFGGILADDMGLGKTLQTLAWILWLRDPHSTLKPAPASAGNQAPDSQLPPPVLVVCPKSVMDNWHAEAARFTPGLRVKSWAASELDGFLAGLDNADVHVLNYSQLRLLGESLASTRWLAVILDEGQYIKNPNSQTAQVARSLRAEQRLVLSGTPIENRLMDLWSLMAFAMPGVLGSRMHFGKSYDAKDDPFARRRLSARVRPFLLRRTKSQVAKDLPDRIEEDLFCEIEGEQKALYRAELKRAQQLLLSIKTQKELAEQQFHFLVSLLRLRQICCHPRLVAADSTAPSAKTEALLEQLEPLMEEGNKVLVFSQFVGLLDLLRPALEERNWPVFYLSGATENRGDLVREFQSKEGEAVFLISLKAGGFGLNLTAASYVVLFDPWWNPAVENQAIDRTHRIGQTNKVIAYRLLIKNSIEEKIRELQKSKKALAEDVLGEERFAQNLTIDDLRFLFAD